MRILPYRTVAEVISGIVITFVDITRITAAETRIQELTDSLRDRVVNLETLLDLIPVGVFIMSDENPGQAALNRAAARLLGRDEAAPAPRMRPSELPLHADGVTMPRASQPLLRAAHTREPVPAFEAQLRREDGTSLDVIVAASPLASARGKPSGAIAAMVDITERRQAEVHQQLLLDELQHRAKNILATVTALARRTGGDSAAAEEATAALVGRLQAMARTHELLSRDLWRGVALDALLRATLEPYLGSRDDEILDRRAAGGDRPEGELDPRDGALRAGEQRRAVRRARPEARSEAGAAGGRLVGPGAGRAALAVAHLEGDARRAAPRPRGARVRNDLHRAEFVLRVVRQRLASLRAGRALLRSGVSAGSAGGVLTSRERMMASDLDRLRGLRILVVEDTFMLAEELSEFLGELGCETIGPAARARDASELVVANALDGALLDVNLSRGETSFPVAADLAGREVPFVFITGYDLDTSFPAEFRGVPRISKPLDLGVLVRTMLRHFAPAAPRPH